MSVINGLPAHILFLHFAVVLVPLTALALVAGALSPKAARRMGLVLPALALVMTVSVLLTIEAGEWLEDHVTSTALIRRHTGMGQLLFLWALGLLVLSAAVWWTTRRTPAQGQAGTRSASVLRIAAAVLSVVVATGAVVDVYRIGDSGAKAAWQNNYSKTPTKSGDGGN